MVDVLLTLGFICCVLFIILFALDVTRGTCRHDWGKWEYAEDSYVFLHKRRCSKCGMHDIKQIRKLWS